MKRWQLAMVGLSVAALILLAALDIWSSPGEPNVFFSGHQVATALLTEVFVLALTYLLVDYLVEARANKRWRDAAVAPVSQLEQLLRVVYHRAYHAHWDLVGHRLTADDWSKRLEFNEELVTYSKRYVDACDALSPLLVSSAELVPLFEACIAARGEALAAGHHAELMNREIHGYLAGKPGTRIPTGELLLNPAERILPALLHLETFAKERVIHEWVPPPQEWDDDALEAVDSGLEVPRA